MNNECTALGEKKTPVLFWTERYWGHQITAATRPGQTMITKFHRANTACLTARDEGIITTQQSQQQEPYTSKEAGWRAVGYRNNTRRWESSPLVLVGEKSFFDRPPRGVFLGVPTLHKIPQREPYNSLETIGEGTQYLASPLRHPALLQCPFLMTKALKLQWCSMECPWVLHQVLRTSPRVQLSTWPSHETGAVRPPWDDPPCNGTSAQGEGWDLCFILTFIVDGSATGEKL